jgi:tetratricopeptide (TPR) repeat protein
VTFRDANVVSTINQRFIPLKVDASVHTALAEALRIQSYPTLVLAAPDGKILGTLEGYIEPERLQEHLGRALVSLDNPDWMNRDYRDAAKAMALSDFARAFALLKSIIEDGKDRPIQAKARQVLQEVEEQAAGRLARAKQLDDQGKVAEAMTGLSELLRVFAGTQAAREGSQLLTSLGAKPEIKVQLRAQRARELLAQARDDYRTQQYLCCLDRCELLAGSYRDLPEGAEALKLAAEIKNNPEWLQQTCLALTDRLGGLYLALAETWMKKGQPQQAVVCLERLIQSCPGTRQADAAHLRLSQIQGQSSWQAELKKR